MTFWTKYSEEVREDIDNQEKQREGIINSGFSGEGSPVSQQIYSIPKIKVDSVSDSDDSQKRKKFLYTICCVGSEMASDSSYDMNRDENKQKETIKLTPEEEAIRCANEAKELPLWRSINNLFAVLVIAIASFIWGFYA